MFCDFFNLKPSDIIKPLTYALVDNFYPCCMCNVYYVYVSNVYWQTYNLLSLIIGFLLHNLRQVLSS